VPFPNDPFNEPGKIARDTFAREQEATQARIRQRNRDIADQATRDAIKRSQDMAKASFERGRKASSERLRPEGAHRSSGSIDSDVGTEPLPKSGGRAWLFGLVLLAIVILGVWSMAGR
jgi:hypothetical protein